MAYGTQNHDLAEFSADDEELASALAVAADTVVDNAALLRDARRRQQWQTAMMTLSTAVLGSDDPAAFALAQIVDHAAATSSAAGVCIGVPAEDPELLRMAAGSGVYRNRIGTTFRTAGRAVAGAGPTVALPMRSEAAVTGVLFVCRKPGEPTFDLLDRELFAGYAGHAAIVLQLAYAHRDNERLRLANDRQQIARDLHQHVIHRMSRLGLDLHGIAARTKDTATRTAIMTKIDDADEIIRALRAAIFALHPTAAKPPG